MEILNLFCFAYCGDATGTASPATGSQGNQQLKETVSQDFRPLYIGQNTPHMNRQQQFREHFRFLKDIREKVCPRSCRRSKLEISNLAIEQIRKNEKVRETVLPVH